MSDVQVTIGNDALLPIKGKTMQTSEFQVLVGRIDPKVETTRGQIFKRYGHNLGVHKHGDIWRVSDLRSGYALTGLSCKTKQSALDEIDAVRKRVGVRKFNQTIRGQLSMQETLDRIRIAKEKWDVVNKLFAAKFRKSLPIDGMLLGLTGERHLDVLKFDNMLNWLDRRYHPSSSTWDVNGPDREENFSMKMAVYRICGDEIGDAISNLLGSEDAETE